MEKQSQVGVGTLPSAYGMSAQAKTYEHLQEHTRSVLSVAFSPDGKTIASGSGDHTIRLWDVSTGKNIRTRTGHADSVYSVAFSPDGKNIRTITRHRGPVYSVAFSPDGNTIATGSADDTIRLWEVSTGGHIRTLTGHTCVGL